MTEECHKSGDNVDTIVYGNSLPKPTEALQLRGPLESEEYYMDYKNRGKCYIFNHKVFDPHTKVEVRHGTDVDAQNLSYRFDALGFDTEVFTDLTLREVLEKLEEAGKEDHTDNSCFVCIILSHGFYGYVFARDAAYDIENVFAPFRGDACPSLVGKPKLFFIQACQGNKVDSGSNVIFKDSTDSVFQFKMPTHADILISYSTVPGFLSWRHAERGSWFMQALCEALEEYAEKKDIIQILTIVNRKVAFYFESDSPDDVIMHRRKQIPFITSTLTRDLKFA